MASPELSRTCCFQVTYGESASKHISVILSGYFVLSHRSLAVSARSPTLIGSIDLQSFTLSIFDFQCPESQREEGNHATGFTLDIIWLNIRVLLTISGLQGKIVLLEFWTYCCINCLPVLPELKTREHKYHEEPVVIGVPSGKFMNVGQTNSSCHQPIRH